MNVSEALRVLHQAPFRHPLLVEQGGVFHEVLSVEFSHEPARAVLKIAEADAQSMSKAFLIEIENLINTLLAALEKLAAPDDVKRALTENGDVEHVHWWITQLLSQPIALPEPEATIAELNGEVPPVPVPVVPAGEPLGETIGVVGARAMSGKTHIASAVFAAFADESLRKTDAEIVAAAAALNAAPVPEDGRSMATTEEVYIAPEDAQSPGESAAVLVVAGVRPSVATDPDQAAGRAKRTRKPKSAPFGTSAATE